MALINIRDANIINENDITGNYQAFGPTYEAPGAGCLDCTDTCNVTCLGSCVGEESSSPSGCSVCTSTCMGTCSGDCTGGCGDASCERECTLSCQSSCSTDCTLSCEDTCEDGCHQSCSNGCKASCTESCSGACQGCTGCSGSCIDVCVNGCKHSCQDVATTSGTHVVVPEWPSGTGTGDEETDELLRVIKEYLDHIMNYDYKRISELDEAVLVHDGDKLAGEIVTHNYDIVQHLNENATRVTTMPEPDETYLDQIYQYIGSDTAQYTDGYFYKCVQNGSAYEWQEYGDDVVTPIDTIDLNDLNLVVSDFDNRTVRITAAALVGFITRNYKNYWIWKPVIESDASGEVKTKISWEYSSSGDSTPPETIDLADIVTGGVGLVTSSDDGIFPHEYFAIIDGKTIATHEFITGKHLDGTAVSDLGFEVLRLTSDNPSAFTINDEFLADLDARYAQQGEFLDAETAAETYLAKADASNEYVKNGNAPSGGGSGVYGDDRYVITGKAPVPPVAGDTNIYGDDRYVMKVPETAGQAAEIDAYLTKSEAEITYAHIGQGGISQSDADDRYVRKSLATTQIPARVAATAEPQSDGSNGLMTPQDVADISSALSDISSINLSISAIEDDIDLIEEQIGSISGVGYATTNYTTGEATAGIVKLPVSSSIKVGANGVIDTKDYSTVNLIRNSLFSDGFTKDWKDNSAIDTNASQITTDSTFGIPVAQISIVADGAIEQDFESIAENGFTVAILFKQNAETAKTLEVKIDTEAYQSHTIPIGSGYYIKTFYFDVDDDESLDTHTLYIHNPDVSTVTFEMSEIMVQRGNKFTGWNRNPFDISSNASINIVSYDNNLTFKDLYEVYAEDVYDETGTIIIHHAGDPINPSSSIIMHKDKNYFYMHITALNEIDGNIRVDTIPLRINLTTGKCDISGNAVSAGTLIDNTGELIPSVAEINAIVDGSALNLVDQPNEITVSTMPTAAEELVGNIYCYTGETTASFTQNHIYHCVFDDPNYIWEEYTGYYKKYQYALTKTVNNVTTELASVPHVGRFTGINNAEIFNDYVSNIADTAFSHVEGQGNNALQSATNAHIEGAGNTATGSASYAHIEGAGNIAENGAAYNHIEGTGHKATGSSTHSHIEGISNTNMQSYGHIEGCDNIGGNYSNHSCGSTMPNGNNLFKSVIVDSLPSISDTYNDEMYLVYDSTNRTYTAWDVNWSSGEGVWENNGSISLSSGGVYGHIEGQYNLMGSTTGHVEGTRNILKTACIDTHIEGANNIVYEGSNQTHVEGKDHVLYNGVNYSHFEGLDNRSGYTGNGSGITALHMEGQFNIAASSTNNTHIEGYNNAIQLAGGNTAHIEGFMNRPAQLNYSHLEGFKNTTAGSLYGVSIGGVLNTVNGGHIGLHVEGKSHTIPAGRSSISMSGTTETVTGTDLGGHVEGDQNKLELNPNISYMATGRAYHIEGYNNKITYKDHSGVAKNTGSYLTIGSHVEGTNNSISYGNYVHAEGYSNWVGGDSTHIEGGSNKSYSLTYSHIEGQSNTCTPYNNYQSSAIHIEGSSNTVSGYSNCNHIEGQSNSLYGANSSYANHIEGANHSFGTNGTRLDITYSHIEGYNNNAEASVQSCNYNHIEGYRNKLKNLINSTKTSVYNNHIEGTENVVGTYYSHVEGASNNIYPEAYSSHTEGTSNLARGGYSHIEGTNNTNYSSTSHIEGGNNVSGEMNGSTVVHNANHSHVEGTYNTALNSMAHVEGYYNTVRSVAGHAEGEYNEILEYAHEAHVGGKYNKASIEASTAIGVCNKYEVDSAEYTDITIDVSAITDNTRYYDTGDNATTTSENGVGLSDYIKYDKGTALLIHAIIDANYTSLIACFYDENKQYMYKKYVTMTTSDTYAELTYNPFDGTNSSYVYTKPPTYFRFTSKMSTSGLNGTYVKSAYIPSLVTIGNGYTYTSGGTDVFERSNVVEVGRTFVNINGDILQNGAPLVSGTPHFVGTSTEWDELSAAEKAEYEGGDIVFTDDNSGFGIVDNVVTKDSVNPITSGAVYAALAEITRPAPIKSDNNYYYCRRYYDGRYCVHYRQRFGNTTLTPNTVNKITPASWAGVTSYFSTVIENVFKDNNNIVSMMVIVTDKENCRNTFSITSLGYDTSNNIPYIYITSQGPDTITDFTVDFVMDTF